MPRAETRQLYYFNGFSSAIPGDLEASPKIVEVAGMARRNGFAFRPVSIDYRRVEWHASQLVEGIAAGAEHVIFWGSSMGGWFARILQVRLAAARPGLRVEAAAFNPAFDLAGHSHLLLGPQENFVTGENYVWTEAHSAAMVRLEQSVDYDASLPYAVYVDRDDEVIDSGLSEARHRGMARFVMYEAGSHSFEHYREAVADFENRLRRGRPAVIE